MNVLYLMKWKCNCLKSEEFNVKKEFLTTRLYHFSSGPRLHNFVNVSWNFKLARMTLALHSAVTS